MEIRELPPFELKNPPPKPPKQPKYQRPPKEPEPTRRERELEHDAYAWTGGRDPSGRRHAAPIDQNEEWFRHKNWAEKRIKVAAALAAAGASVNTLDAFQNCGSEAIVEFCEAEGRYRLRGNYCHNRHCEVCMRSKANLLAANLRAKLEENKTAHYRFITLTLLHSNLPLAAQIKKLYEGFKKLRTTKCWKGSQRGGAAILEIKWNAKTGKWHPHLHVISEGSYLQKEELSAAWLHSTKDSYIVDIRHLDKAKDVAFYVGKYVTKGTNAEVWEDSEVAAEYVTATKGVRSCATFGSWRGFRLLAKPTSTAEWRPIMRLSTLVARARAGDVQAAELLEVLRDNLQYDPHRKRGRKTG